MSYPQGITIEEDDNKEICIRCANVAGIDKGGRWDQVDLEPDPACPAAAYRHVRLVFPPGVDEETVARAERFFRERVNEWGEGHNHPRWVSRKNATDAALIFEARLDALEKFREKPWYGAVKKRIEGMARAAWKEADAKGGPE